VDYKGSKALDITLFLVMSSSWALNYSFLKIALGYEPPMVALFFRVLFASVFSIVFSFSSMRFVKKIGFLKLFLMSVFNVSLFMGLWFIGEMTEPSSVSSILVYTYPIFTVVFSGFFLNESLSAGKIVGLIIGFAGVIVIFYDEFAFNFGIGLFFLLASAVSWAVGTIFYKKYLKDADMGAVNSYQFILALPVVFAASLLYGGFRPLTMNFILITLYMGSIGSSVAYFIYWGLIRKYKVSHVSPYLFSVPALSILFSIFINNEIAKPLTLAGFALVAAGIFASSR